MFLFKKSIFGNGLVIMFMLSLLLALGAGIFARTEKPVLHGKHWMAITGKPL
ncbi:MAG: hypothetical protein GTO24_22395, partial [candidate division Zixibacteria bacterium]|nr:hypothetical protein [candidate division Zixibacteria bacterium]